LNEHVHRTLLRIENGDMKGMIVVEHSCLKHRVSKRFLVLLSGWGGT
jgi:hypothetical protein